MNGTVIFFFLLIVGLTLYITYWAAKKTKSTGEFYTAGGGLTGWQNGSAIFIGTPLFPLENPAIISVPLGFLGGYLGTILSKEYNLKRYAEVKVKANTGFRE